MQLKARHKLIYLIIISAYMANLYTTQITTIQIQNCLPCYYNYSKFTIVNTIAIILLITLTKNLYHIEKPPQQSYKKQPISPSEGDKLDKKITQQPTSSNIQKLESLLHLHRPVLPKHIINEIERHIEEAKNSKNLSSTTFESDLSLYMTQNLTLLYIDWGKSQGFQETTGKTPKDVIYSIRKQLVEIIVSQATIFEEEKCKLSKEEQGEYTALKDLYNSTVKYRDEHRHLDSIDNLNNDIKKMRLHNLFPHKTILENQ